MEINRVYVKTRAEFGKQCMFGLYGPHTDVDILPHPSDMNDYIRRTHCNIGVQQSKQFALHEIQTVTKVTKHTGMYHFEGGWPKEINPRDEETTTRFRRRIEKDDNWAPKLRNLLEAMEHNILQNGAVNIYQHYFDDMIPTPLVQSLGFRTVNVYSDPETPKRPVTNISWSPHSGSRIAVCYCFLDYGRQPDYSKRVYIWEVENPNEPYMALEPPCHCAACEFNPRDPSVLASGLMTGQVCCWDIRTGNTPVQTSHLQWSHREFANAVKWVPTKSNTEFFSTSSDGRAMWWDTRQLRNPIEVLMFDLEFPNDPHMDRAVGVSCLNFGPMIGTKFMFGLENGFIITGSRKMKTNAEKLAVRYVAHYGQVYTVDRNVFNPALFLTVGDWRARVWAEDTREGTLVSTPFMRDYPTGGCWNKARFSVFYVTTGSGRLLVWDILQTLRKPVFTLQLCDERLTALAPCDEGVFLAIGNCVGNVYLVEPTDYFQTFEKADRSFFSEYLERCSKLTKAVDVRLREIRLVQKITAEEEEAVAAKSRDKPKSVRKTAAKSKDKGRTSRPSKDKSVQKEKKKVRVDGPELATAETKYFEAVQQGLEAYASETDLEVIPVFQLQTGTKKSEKKRRSFHGKKEDDPKRTGKKVVEKELRIRPSAKLVKTGKSLAQMSAKFTAKASTHSVVTPGSPRVVEETWNKKKRPKGKVTFVAPIPCKGEICKPKVCCWRERRKKQRRKEAKRKMDGGSRQASVLSTKLSESSRLQLKRKHSSCILRDIHEPPGELTEEVAIAKEEIRIAVLKEKMKRSTVTRRLVGDRKVRKRKKRKVRYGGKIVEHYYDDDEEDEESRSKEGGKRKVAPIQDPCSPPRGRTALEMFSKLLRISTPELTEEKLIGKDYLKALDQIRRRIYPRISEFGSYRHE